jgi:hypothetical protein
MDVNNLISIPNGYYLDISNDHVYVSNNDFLLDLTRGDIYHIQDGFIMNLTTKEIFVFKDDRNVLGHCYWTPQTLVVEDAAPTHVVMTGLISNTSALASDFTIAGFIVSSLSTDVTNKILTLVLSTTVSGFDSLIVIYKGNSYGVTNNIILLAPQSFNTEVISDTEINLTWGDSLQGGTGYKIESSLNGTDWSVLHTLAGSNSSYADTTRTEDTLVYYRIRIYKGTTYSDYSSVRQARTLLTRANDFIARITAKGATYTEKERLAVTNCIKSLQAIDMFENQFDVLVCYNNFNAIASLENMIKDSSHSEAIASPTFTAFLGYKTDGSTSYIDTHFTPSTQGSKYAVRDSCFIMKLSGTPKEDWVRHGIVYYDGIFGTQGSVLGRMVSSSNIDGWRFIAHAYTVGWNVLSRSSASSQKWFNKTIDAEDTSSNTYSKLPTGSFHIHKPNIIDGVTGYYPWGGINEVSECFAAGKAISKENARLVFDILDNYFYELYWFPYAPLDLTATAISDTIIELNWINVDTVGDGVKIESSPDGLTWTQITTVNLGISTYTNISLELETKYYYRVRSYKGTHNSEYTDVVNSTTLILVNSMSLTATGNGTGYSKFIFYLSSMMTITVDGAAKLYDADMSNESTSKDCIIGWNSLLVRCSTGKAHILIPDPLAFIAWGLNEESDYTGWLGSTNSPNLTGRIDQFLNIESLSIFSNNSISGNLGLLTKLRLCRVFDFQKLTGDVSGLTNLELLYLTSHDNSSYGINGTVDNMPNIKFLDVAGIGNFGGDLSSKDIQWFDCRGNTRFYGDITNFVNCPNYFFASCQVINGWTGTLDGLCKCKALALFGIVKLSPYVGGKVWVSPMNYFWFAPSTGNFLTSAELDALLIDLSTTTWDVEKYIRIGSGNAQRTSASDAAIATLTGMGVIYTHD